MDPQKAAEVILEAANVPNEQYRMGRSKVQDTFDSAKFLMTFSRLKKKTDRMSSLFANTFLCAISFASKQK